MGKEQSCLIDFAWDKSEYKEKVREAFVRRFGSNHRKDTAIHCYACGHDGAVVYPNSDPNFYHWPHWHYHWSGFTFHTQCVPDDDQTLKHYLK